MRDSMVFYRSFYEAIENLPNKNKLNVLTALFEYALNGFEMELSGVDKTVFLLVKPQIDANNKRYENGKKGGRNKAKNNQKETKPKPSNNQDITKAKPNVNENVNDKKKKYGEFKHVLLTDAERERLINDFGDVRLKQLIISLDEGIELKGYKYKNHNLALRKWAKNDTGKGKNVKKTNFSNFKERNYDFDDLEKQLIRKTVNKKHN